MDEKPNKYASGLAIIKSCCKQLKAFDKSVNRAVNVFSLSIDFFQFSSMAMRQCYALSPCGKLHWYFENRHSK